MSKYPNQFQMERDMTAPNMTGRKDLGRHSIPAQAIPKQSNITTRTGTASSHDKAGGKKNIDEKMKKVMQMASKIASV